MIPFGKNILPFFGLFALTFIAGVGFMRADFPVLNLALVNLIFLSLLFQNVRIAMFTGLGISMLYSILWFTPLFEPKPDHPVMIYAGTILLFAACTGVSIFILNLNSRTTQSLKHFFLLYENATEGIIIADGLGKIVMANPTACKLFGYKEEDLLNKPVEILIPQRKRNDHPHQRMSYLERPTNREMGKGRELTALRIDGSEFPVEISLSSYREKKRTFVIAFIIDITIRKHNEQIILENSHSLEKLSKELSMLNEDLEKKIESRTKDLRMAMEDLEASRAELKEALSKEKELNEIKSRFVSMASHEFRTPLSAVLSSASLIERYAQEADQTKREKHIQRIKESVRHLNSILEDFLSLGKLEEHKISVVKTEENIPELLKQIMEEVEVLKKEGQRFILDCNARETGFTDKNLLRGIITNLVSNAIKFSGNEGQIRLSCRDENKQLVVEVSDNGMGIPPEDMNNLFSSFFRSKNANNIQGTGLGLHIVKRYVELLGGNIQINSQLNQGTTVTVTLPY